MTLRRIEEKDIRKAGLVPGFGHWSYKCAKQLISRLAENYDIEISYEHCINAAKRQWQWKYYKFIELDDNNCILREKLFKPLSEEKKAILKRKMLNNEQVSIEEFQSEEYLSLEITKIDIVDLCVRHDAYQASIKIDDKENE